MIAIHWIIVYASLGNQVNINLLVFLGTGILFVVLGNYMGQIRHNYFFFKLNVSAGLIVRQTCEKIYLSQSRAPRFQTYTNAIKKTATNISTARNPSIPNSRKFTA